ncbi:MAG: DNA gyrase subunit B, partial [Phycisphaerae bacterium]
ADVDGSHIRTLLLTFFFRYMRPLIDNGHVFIAQPPLYLISRRRTKKYVLDDREMSRTLIDLGLDGTTLEIRDLSGAEPKVINEFDNERLRKLLVKLENMGEKIRILERRGLRFKDLMQQRKDGKLPTHWLVVDGVENLFHSQDEFDTAMAEINQAAVLEEDEMEDGADQPEDAPRIQKRAELHEVRDIQRLAAEIEDEFEISLDDYFLTRPETITGDRPPAKFIYKNEDEIIEVDNVAGIVPGLRQIGSKGIEIKRFKGLGEMNADELWETTMDVERRTLLRVKAEEAEEAERMFSLLMGDNVENRRSFIERHALEVKNLDI